MESPSQIKQIKKDLEDVQPRAGGLTHVERAKLLEARASRARAIGDEKAERRYGSQATAALSAAEAGDETLSRNPEVPHLGEITIRKVESDEQHVPVQTGHEAKVA